MVWIAPASQTLGLPGGYEGADLPVQLWCGLLLLTEPTLLDYLGSSNLGKMKCVPILIVDTAIEVDRDV